jgi:hypothetical protein
MLFAVELGSWLARGIIGSMLGYYSPDEDLRNAQAKFSLE